MCACGASASRPPADPIDVMRKAAADSADGEAVGRWLLGELMVPGGDTAGVKAARKRLDALPPQAQKGMFAALARAIHDEVHGRFRSAASAHVDALAAARTSQHPDASLVAWFVASHLLSLRTSVNDLWAQARELVLKTLAQPGNVGWRARSELVQWWSLDGFPESAPAAPVKGAAAPAPSADKPAAASGVLEAAARQFGCIDKARMAGPFGHLATTDHRVHFEAERAGPWPAVFPKDPLRQIAPRVLSVERVGCALRAIGAPGGGIFYIETFVDLPAEREVIVAVQGALAVLVDDVEVLTRDTRQWGVWARYGARLRLGAGRHRIVARVPGGESSIRLLTERGTPLDVETSADPAPPYALVPPEILADPNALDPFMIALSVPPQPGTPQPEAPRDTSDPISRVLAAYLAHVEGQDDMSSVLLEPLVKDAARATGPALALQASFLEKDPILPPDQARDRTKEARLAAGKKDPELWWPLFWLALDAADKAGLPEAVPQLVALADQFREVPEIQKGLAAIYGKLGWKVEHARAVKEAATRFPDDIDAQGALLRLYDEEGEIALADQVAARIKKLDRDAEVDFERAVQRRDYRAAIQELQRLGSIRNDRRDIAARIADLLTRAGAALPSMQKLEIAVQKRPEDASARLALADARFAGGERDALRKALVDAIHAGSDTGPLREAIELVDGITELSPYRIDGRKVIAEYEASKEEMPGSAARVLDYSAIWVHSDGSARMLEHEIIGIQSREAIQEHAEQRPPRGLVLKIRTIKRDGRVLEPEIVEGKQTVTMPHLEVGDYIETESVNFLRGDGQGGQRFEGPRWLFREEKIPYWRSEFIAISPKNRSLDIETGGKVPAPTVTESGALVIHRWRVDQSPALPEEPASAPVQEFLPNVRISWGINLKDAVARLIDAAADETPRDPRLVRIAEGIVGGELSAHEGEKSGPSHLSIDKRARRIYRWVLANVEAGRETDARRIVTGKSGNRAEAFLYLCRLSGIEAWLGLVRDRLAPPPNGPMSEVEAFGSLAVRVTTERGPRWMVVREKFAPYGYMPSSMRGQPALILRPGPATEVRGARPGVSAMADAPRETTPSEGSKDQMTQAGTVDLAADGSATIDVEQRFEGKLAILLRSVLETLPDARLKETIESRLLPQWFPGARVLSVEVKNLADLDEPLILSMKLEMSTFARTRPGEIVISPPFPRQLGALASLPSRETPLYLSEQISMGVAMKLAIKLPPGARVAEPLVPMSAEDEGRIVRVNDRIDRGMLVLDRFIDLPAGRIQSNAYPKFQDFARKGDAALRRDLVLTLSGEGR